MIICEYCDHDIDVTCWGWGYYIDDKKSMVYFHSECLEVSENVVMNREEAW